MKDKNFKLKKEEIKRLLPRPMGVGMATDKIVVHGESSFRAAARRNHLRKD
jgi:hypothetical protein